MTTWCGLKQVQTACMESLDPHVLDGGEFPSHLELLVVALKRATFVQFIGDSVDSSLGNKGQ